jgi:methyl-accepting chemotaxis protein
MLKAEKDIFGIWAVFAANGWDGKDAAFARDPQFAPKGAFVPWAYREEGEIKILAGMNGDEKEEDYNSDYYKIPMESGKSLFLEPYTDTTGNGGEVLMTTFAEPILDASGKALGSMGIDISLDFLGGLLSGNASNDGSYARLLSPGMRSSPTSATRSSRGSPCPSSARAHGERSSSTASRRSPIPVGRRISPPSTGIRA